MLCSLCKTIARPEVAPGSKAGRHQRHPCPEHALVSQGKKIGLHSKWMGQARFSPCTVCVAMLHEKNLGNSAAAGMSEGKPYPKGAPSNGATSCDCCDQARLASAPHCCVDRPCFHVYTALQILQAFSRPPNAPVHSVSGLIKP